MPYFEFIGEDAQRKSENAAKFWEITQNGASFTVHFGKIGTKGQVKDKACSSVEAATAEVEKLINEKVKKGYIEKTK